MAAAIAAFALAAGTASASQVIYSNSFEKTDNAAYDPDASIVGVDNWTLASDAGTARIATDSPAEFQGTQFVRLSDQAIINRTFPAAQASEEIKGVVWVEGYFRGQGSNSTLAAADYGATDASAIVHFSQTEGIEFANGAGDGTYTVTPSSIKPLESARWYKITIRLNFDTKKWDVWVDNVKRGSNLGFRNNSVTRLGGFKNLAQQQADFDGFRVVKPRVGDANGDASLDAADLVAASEQSLFANDPIAQGNGDFDGNGVVDTADLESLRNRLIAK